MIEITINSTKNHLISKELVNLITTIKLIIIIITTKIMIICNIASIPTIIKNKY